MRILLGLASVSLLLAGCAPAPGPALPAGTLGERGQVEEAPVETVEEVEAEEPQEVAITEEEARTTVFPVVFDSTRLVFIQTIEELYSVESVDSYVYDPESATVRLDATSVYASSGNVRDAAWEIARLFGSSVYSSLGDNGTWLLDNPRFAPGLRVTLSSEVAYDCDGETMRLLGEVKLSRDDWETACRIR